MYIYLVGVRLGFKKTVLEQPKMCMWCLIPDRPVERYVCGTRVAGSPPAFPWPAVVNYTDGTRTSTLPTGPARNTGLNCCSPQLPGLNPYCSSP